MKKVAELPLDADCASFAQWLSEHRVPHQFVEEGGRVALYVTAERAIEVQQALSAYISNSRVKERIDRSVWSPSSGNLLNWHVLARPLRVPVVFVCVIASVVVALVTGFGESGPLLRAMVFSDPFQVMDDTLAQRINAVLHNLSGGQWWRLFSPALLHFNALHLIFNMTWLWYLGARVEFREGSWRIFGLVVMTAVVSNVAQFLVSGPFFGGMSGVVYGLFGYCWLFDMGRKQPVYGVSPVLFGFILFWLVLGFADVTDMLGVGKMANIAHLAGLAAGLLAAGVVRKSRLP
ncbi:MAG: rhomboid family intramembrane serine protease [Proteobacteria bacterium]|nr:MAG: rhomboid family intramembrane serine protease [Pseudomonadota bacterium]PIE40188.1 MAG: rhomboid family intramembrane serine protease [Gammaproteobacteria bacterium]